MIFYRKSANPTQPSSLNIRQVRWFSLVALIAYPTGAIVALIGGQVGQKWIEVVGLGFILLALLCFIGIIGTGVQRIVGEQKQALDEMELHLRQQAYSRAYHVLGVVVLLSALYLGIASNGGQKLTLWTPSEFDHWNAIIWGLILLVTVLPTGLLAWSLPTADIEDDDLVQS